MNSISFNSNVCRNLDQALKKEWLERNRLGGYAASTIVSVNTRRYHGLLVAKLHPPLEHLVLLSNVEEILYVDETAYPLSTLLYRDTINPEGYRNLNQFFPLPFPTWIFHVEDLIFAKSLVFMYDEQTVLLRYQILSGDENLVRLELKPLMAFRDFHSLGFQNDRLNTKIKPSAGRIQFSGAYFYHNAAIVDQAGNWYCRVQYPQEKSRGLDFEEDLYAPFRLVYTFIKGRTAFFCASLNRYEKVDPDALIIKESDRRNHVQHNKSPLDIRF
ncbi:MAG: hypothetical protein A3C35_02730 [Omnitrophica bacterium RIFCSPHIGHO2_02_FULL_46_11]|nr:MAG: hypothetical protein A3C35_02730 [Omnitrophica bacterium RIFCSPHIGHO2_02_FULL_46_11]OGW87623.1 MAG: hypothetical protein A3A81_04730 [Omnitrophica bacterium RIFCSPLOWO2_01_FULL_45_10b]